MTTVDGPAREPLARHVTWAVLLGGLLLAVAGSIAVGRPGAPMAWVTVAALTAAAVAYRSQRWRAELAMLPLCGVGLAVVVGVGWVDSIRSPLVLGLLVAAEAALARRMTGIVHEVTLAVDTREARRRTGGD